MPIWQNIFLNDYDLKQVGTFIDLDTTISKDNDEIDKNKV